MYYIDSSGRLIFEFDNIKAEITGIKNLELYSFKILWEK